MKTKIGSEMTAAMTLAMGSLLLLSTPSAAQDDYKTLAKDFSRTAVKFHINKVAVVPFSSGTQSEAPEGKIVAERIATQMTRLGRVELVERELLAKVMQERYLAAAGSNLQTRSQDPAAILPVDALITGSIFPKENKIEIHARMIDVRTGKVLSATQIEVEKEWTELVSVPTFQVAVPELEVQVPTAFHDALADNACDQAEDQVNTLERSIINIKALYWAARLKSPDFSMAKLTHNPGSEITDRSLRRHFYELLQGWYDRPDAPRLSSEDMARITQVEGQISRIVEKCNG